MLRRSAQIDPNQCSGGPDIDNCAVNRIKEVKSKRPERLVSRIIMLFKAARLEAGMSHEDLAKKSGVTRPAISHIESGRRRPSLLMSLRLAEALGKNLSDIIREAEKQEDENR